LNVKMIWFSITYQLASVSTTGTWVWRITGKFN
jgi:hypothetical protein